MYCSLFISTAICLYVLQLVYPYCSLFIWTVICLPVLQFVYMYCSLFTCTAGNRPSRTLCPVSRGWLAGSFSVTGLGCLTGQT